MTKNRKLAFFRNTVPGRRAAGRAFHMERSSPSSAADIAPPPTRRRQVHGESTRTMAACRTTRPASNASHAPSCRRRRPNRAAVHANRMDGPKKNKKAPICLESGQECEQSSPHASNPGRQCRTEGNSSQNLASKASKSNRLATPRMPNKTVIPARRITGPPRTGSLWRFSGPSSHTWSQGETIAFQGSDRSSRSRPKSR